MENTNKTIDITLTPAGFRHMKILFQESMDRYLKELEILQGLQTGSRIVQNFNDDEVNLLARALETLEINIEKRIKSLRETLFELEKAGY
jgi:predicted HicB family RNase H-like nuclease